MGFCAKATSAVAALVLTAVPIWAKPKIAELAHQCDSLGKQKACRELAKLAEQDKDTAVRIEAIKVLNDEAVLSRIIERDLFPAVRQAAEARLKAIRSKGSRLTKPTNAAATQSPIAVATSVARATKTKASSADRSSAALHAFLLPPCYGNAPSAGQAMESGMSSTVAALNALVAE